MIARAPGKLVISGAYSVLEGAQALVAAVDRYVEADASRPAPQETAEVQVAIRAGKMKRAPWFDASALRVKLPDGRDVKLGLGSSAAILVASMAAAWAAEDRTLDSRVMLWAAIAAHREAQRGGSGIDVAAAVFGGVIACRLGQGGSLGVQPHLLPAGFELRVFASQVPASTPEMVRKVRAFAAKAPAEYAVYMGRAKAGAARAITATTAADLVGALRAQAQALGELGAAAGAPILTPDVVALAAIAEEEGAVFYPSGAGGGDVALFAGVAPPTQRFLTEAAALGRVHIPMQIGAPGVQLISTSSPSRTPIPRV
jgi:phosphomevalonate kinase